MEVERGAKSERVEMRQHLGGRAGIVQRGEGGAMGGAGVTVTAATVQRRRVLGEINTASKRAERKKERQAAQTGSENKRV